MMKFNRFFKILLYLFITGFLFITYCYFETYWIKIKRVDIISADIPEVFNGKKIVFIADIHHGPFFALWRVKKLVRHINELKPDIILLGGDYCHRKSKYIIPAFDELNKLRATTEIYGVLGNHDHWEGANLTREMMIRNGIKLCDNRSYWLKLANDSIKIGGVGDLWEDEQMIENTIYDVKQKDFCILLSHNPDYIEQMNTDLVDLVLSGHTHGGQMTLFGLWAPVLPSKYGQKYRYGSKDIGNMKAYITSGIGTITPPQRFFCRPEIVVINLKRK